MAFEELVLTDGEGQNRLSLHFFEALLNEFSIGQKTDVETISAIELSLGATLTANQEADIQALLDAIDSASPQETKAKLVRDFYHVLIIATHGLYYNSLSLLKARLNLL